MILAGTCDLPVKCLSLHKYDIEKYGYSKCLRPGITYYIGVHTSILFVVLLSFIHNIQINNTMPLSQMGQKGPSWLMPFNFYNNIDGTTIALWESLNYCCLFGVTWRILGTSVTSSLHW